MSIIINSCPPWFQVPLVVCTLPYLVPKLPRLAGKRHHSWLCHSLATLASISPFSALSVLMAIIMLIPGLISPLLAFPFQRPEKFWWAWVSNKLKEQGGVCLQQTCGISHPGKNQQDEAWLALACLAGFIPWKEEDSKEWIIPLDLTPTGMSWLVNMTS